MNAHQKEFSPRSFRENCTGNRLLILQRRLVNFFLTSPLLMDIWNIFSLLPIMNNAIVKNKLFCNCASV